MLPLFFVAVQHQEVLPVNQSEAYIAVLSFYNYVKGAAKANAPGAQTIYDDLSARFPGRSQKKEDTTA